MVSFFNCRLSVFGSVGLKYPFVGEFYCILLTLGGS